MTVSRVCNEPEKVVMATRDRVTAAMRDLGYVPNLAARTMRTHATRTIGFLIPDLTLYPNAAVAQAAADHLAEQGYAILLASSDQQPERGRHLDILRTRQVDGIILYACDQTHPGLCSAVRELDVPSVLLDRDMSSTSEDRIFSDHGPGMVEAITQLIEHGHRHITFLQYDMAIRPRLERQRFFWRRPVLPVPITVLRPIPLHRRQSRCSRRLFVECDVVRRQFLGSRLLLHMRASGRDAGAG